MANKRVRRTQEDKNQAAIQYAIHGVMSKVSKDTSIPRTTLISWSDQDWWVDIIDTVRHEKQQEHIATYSRIVDAAQAVVLEKIEDASASQASLIACQAQDKGLLLQGRPTSISSSAQTPQQVADQFMKMIQASDKAIVPKSKIIEHED